MCGYGDSFLFRPDEIKQDSTICQMTKLLFVPNTVRTIKLYLNKVFSYAGKAVTGERLSTTEGNLITVECNGIMCYLRISRVLEEFLDEHTDLLADLDFVVLRMVCGDDPIEGAEYKPVAD